MDEAIKKHNIVERKIKFDIVRKNTLRKQLTRDISKVVRWAESLNTVKNRRKRKRYVKNIERYVPGITKTKKTVLELIDDLNTRMKDELKYSENEIADLQETYKKEYEEMVNARKMFIKAKNGSLNEQEIEEIAGKSVEEMVMQKGETPDSGEKEMVIPKEELLVKARKRLKMESKDAEKVNNELESEEKDKILFQNEIKRMALEKKILS
ncbi:MAG: hypothetical protein JXB88_09950 [Spirochaetales bacterium]|nr:hypothetical protein [Spirochaetales bacterium]